MDKVKVLICDDSALMRKLISEIVNSCDELEVVDTAMNGKFALQKVKRLNPDIILLDVEMPEMNGLEFLYEFNKLKTEIPVVMLSSLVKKGSQVTLKALELGAKDYILKPSGSISTDIEKVGNTIINYCIIYGNRYKSVKTSQKKYLDLAVPKYDESKTMNISLSSSNSLNRVDIRYADFPFKVSDEVRPKFSNPEILAIGVSTGGPQALRKMLKEFPEDFPLPIVIVQHMPPGFTLDFANSLNNICALKVREASAGDVISSGNIYIAPGDKHMRLKRRAGEVVVELDESSPLNGHKPSVDMLFSDVEEIYKNRSIALIMTGMGRDGAANIGKIYNSGGFTLCQDKFSSVVYGMPNIARQHDYIDMELPLDVLAQTIIRIVSRFY